LSKPCSKVVRNCEDPAKKNTQNIDPREILFNLPTKYQNKKGQGVI
jgi:hypothetical protein